MNKLLNFNGGAWGLLTVHVLLHRTCTLATGYFHVKTKIPKEDLRVDYYLLLKYLKAVNHPVNSSGLQ